MDKQKLQQKLERILVHQEYPYLRSYYLLTPQKFRRLCDEFKYDLVYGIPDGVELARQDPPYRDEYIFIRDKWNQNVELNNITDYFTEHCRVRCRFAKRDSPLEHWQKHRGKILLHAIENGCQRDENLQLNCIRDAVYDTTRLCNNFRVSILMTVLMMFRVRKWLDISAGWGDRLLAAIACQLELYVGTDPNPCLHTGYQEMIRYLVPLPERPNYVMIESGFETAEIPADDFDVVFTSPPFFDLEKYSTAKDDSITRYQTIEDWYNHFLMVSLKKAAAHLRSGGHMILYLEILHEGYIERMVRDVSRILDYEGNIYYYYPGAKIYRRMFVWRKP